MFWLPVLINLVSAIIFSGLLYLFFRPSLEKVKAVLTKEATSHKIVFSVLHAERATGIKKLYQGIVMTEQSCLFLTRIFSLYFIEKNIQPLDQFKIACEEFRKVFKYYLKNRLFINEALAGKCGVFMDKTGIILSEWMLRDKNSSEQWLEIHGRMEKEIAPLKKIIEKEFRHIIGIE